MKPILQTALAFNLLIGLSACARNEVPPAGTELRSGPTSRASATQAIEAEAKADAAAAANNPGGAPEAPRPAVARAVESVYPALVRIAVVTTEPEGGRLQKYQSGGSGAIISDDGHVITNHHVAGKARQIFCIMPDGEKIEAALVGTDALADILVLKLKPDPDVNPDAAGRKWPVARFGDSDKLRIGDVVYAMGSPSAISQSVTRGIVSNTRMTMPELLWPMTFRLDGEEVGTLVRWIGHDAVIFGGNSGGPLVNEDGRIVGINEIGIASMGGAIPSNLARSVAEQIISGGTVQRSWVGLEAQPRLLAHRAARGDAQKGVLVGGVIKNSPAAKAGLEPGDIVTKYDGVDVDCSIPEELPLFNRLILGTPIGKTVAIDFRRGGDARSAQVTTIGRETAQGKAQETKSWGMTTRDFTMLSMLELKRENRDGVLVETVRPGGPVSEAKPAIDAGDIILEVGGKPVKDLKELRAVSEEATRGKEERVPMLVGFERENKRYLTVVRVGKEEEEDNPLQARKAWLAAATQVLTRDLAEALPGLADKTGVRITQVYPGRNADKAGLKVGDVILTVDGEAIPASEPEHAELFPTMLRQRRIGSEVTLDVVRGPEPMRLKVKLEAPPTPASELKRYRDDDFEFTAREMSFDDRVTNKLEESLRGVVIERVEPASWAQVAHVTTGDILISVDGTPTPDAKTIETVMKLVKEKKQKRVVFFVRRGIHTQFLELEPGWEDLEE
jgi:serine protease Do